MVSMSGNGGSYWRFRAFGALVFIPRGFFLRFACGGLYVAHLPRDGGMTVLELLPFFLSSMEIPFSWRSGFGEQR